MTNKLKLGDKVRIPILNVCGMYISQCSKGYKIRYGLMDIIITSPPKKAHVRKKRPIYYATIDELTDDYINEDIRGERT
jgi:hypothetical protein